MADNKGVVRNVALIFVIVPGALFCAVCWWGYFIFKPMIWPAIMFTGIYVWVLVSELIAALTGYKKTVSTRYTHWLQKSTKNKVIGWIGLFLFWFAMTALVIHLGWV